MKKVLVAGGGAAGFFAAINIAELSSQRLHITILEKSRQWLAKVKISGGGRCNITNGATDPTFVSGHYPRGQKEMRSALHHFGTADTVQWFHERGVPLKTESDGRVFPISDSSSTIIHCFMQLAEKHRITLVEGEGLQDMEWENNLWQITSTTKQWQADVLVLATGSSQALWEMLERKNIPIVPPVPSLFTFNISDTNLKNLSGVSVPNAKTSIVGTQWKSEGPLLLTHWGLSGPAIIKLSAWAARDLYDRNYTFTLTIQWVESKNQETCLNDLKAFRQHSPKKKITSQPFQELPHRLWEVFCIEKSKIHPDQTWADVPNASLVLLSQFLMQTEIQVHSKSTFKDEFVTAGGIHLKEVDFKTMALKNHPNLYACGEVLDIDGITGGFNFQAAWTTAMLVARGIQKII